MTNVSPVLDVALIRQVSHMDQTAEGIFKGLISRQRHRRTTHLKQFYLQLLKTGYSIDRTQFLAIFKYLEQAGAGTLIEGRGMQDAKFDWTFTVQEVVKPVMGDASLTENVKPLVKLGGKPPYKTKRKHKRTPNPIAPAPVAPPTLAAEPDAAITFRFGGLKVGVSLPRTPLQQQEFGRLITKLFG